MSEQPEEMLDGDAPPGTPIQRQVVGSAHPVWCAHGVEWLPTRTGWTAADAASGNHQGHEYKAVEVGAIPCQPTYFSEEAWKTLAEVRILTAAESDRSVQASLDAYTKRTDSPPVEGVCECYRDWTGLRIPLRRPCPVHGTTSGRDDE